MAQVGNQKGKANNNTKKDNHSWSFDTVAKKDLNKNQWPFKVVKDKGTSNKMEIRSLTDLNKSFDNTEYNLNNCAKVKSRYTLLCEAFERNCSKEDISNITHLLLTFDTAYYLVKKEISKGNETDYKYELKGLSYGVNLLNTDDMHGLITSILYRSKYLDNNIKEAFKLYNDSMDIAYLNSLRNEVNRYLVYRRKMRVLDSDRGLIDVLKSNLNFTSLQYLVFMPMPKQAKDYQSLVRRWLINENINPEYYSEIEAEIQKLPTLENEINKFSEFVKSVQKKELHRSIRKVFYIDNQNLFGNKETLKKDVYDFFKSITGEDKYKSNCVYISDAEQLRVEKNKTKNEQETLDKVNKIKNLEDNIIKSYSEVLDMLLVMNSMTKTAERIHQKGLEINNAEYNIWINEYDIGKIKNRIDSIYGFQIKDNESNEGHKVKLYPISKIFNNIQVKIGCPISIDLDMELNYFYANIVPTYFKDDTLGLERFNIDKIGSNDLNERVEHLYNLKNIINDIKSNFMHLFEVFLGVQYATFGVFMVRYGIAGLSMTKMLITNLVNKYNGKSFNITKSVNHNANLAFYTLQLGLDSLKYYNSETVSSTSDMYGIGELAYFIKKYLEAISDVEITELTYYDNQNKRYSNLLQVAFNIVDILDTCKNLVHLDINDDENREKLNRILQKNIGIN